MTLRSTRIRLDDVFSAGAFLECQSSRMTSVLGNLIASAAAAPIDGVFPFQHALTRSWAGASAKQLAMAHEVSDTVSLSRNHETRTMPPLSQ